MSRSTLSTLEVDMALLSVSRLMCGTWGKEYCVDVVLADSAHCVSVVLVGVVACF